MTATTDGRSFVYGVFDSDGCECKALLAIFATSEKAEAYAGSRQRQPMRDGDGVTVESLALDEELT